MTSDSDLEIITSSDVANYIVCPEAWRLKRNNHDSQPLTVEAQQSQARRNELLHSLDLSSSLLSYARILFYLLFLIAVVVLLWDPREFIRNSLYDDHHSVDTSPPSTPTQHLSDVDSK